MEKIDMQGNIIGFFVLGARNLAKIPLPLGNPPRRVGDAHGLTIPGIKKSLLTWTAQSHERRFDGKVGI